MGCFVWGALRVLSLGGPLLSPFSWFVGVAAWGVGCGTVHAGSFG